MIVKQKILIEVDSPCINGIIYQYEDCVKMMVKINKEKISGDIVGIDKLKDKSYYYIENPEMIVDINDDNRTMYVIADINIDESEYSKEELKLFDEIPWRLSINGDGDVDEETKIVKNYVLKKVNIEFLPELMYNEENNN